METARQEFLLMLTTPLYVFIICTEVLLSHLHHKELYAKRDSLTNLLLMVLNALCDLLMRGVFFFILYFFWQQHLLALQPVWLYWLLLLIAEDFVFYWLHYLEHHSRFFWAVHVTHHSSEHFNFTTGFRSSVFQPLYRFIFFIPLAWLAFTPSDIMLIFSATQIVGILAHTQLVGKLGWAEHLLATPSNHRVHHASNVKYLDKNLGMVFMVWDKLFDTYQEEDPFEPVRFGLTRQPDYRHAGEVLFLEWQAIWQDVTMPGLSWKQRWMYVFGPPGWSHDGSRKTSKELQAELEHGIEPVQEAVE
jgi:sterol desaturase/sphingolipid hydroxylase (fatty acid hydroxylase superfamily)